EDRLTKVLRTIPVIATPKVSALLRKCGVHPDSILSEASLMNPSVDEISKNLGLLSDDATPRTVGRHRVVIVGNGMVGYKVCDALTSADGAMRVHVTALGEESLPAYDRVHLSEFFSGKTANDLLLEPLGWYRERGIDLRLNAKVVHIDRESRVVRTATGEEYPYDSLVLATGAAPFVPPVPGLEKKGVFVYRTVDDLEAITEYAKKAQSAAVIGGGLFGRVAAKAAKGLGVREPVGEAGHP